MPSSVYAALEGVSRESRGRNGPHSVFRGPVLSVSKPTCTARRFRLSKNDRRGDCRTVRGQLRAKSLAGPGMAHEEKVSGTNGTVILLLARKLS